MGWKCDSGVDNSKYNEWDTDRNMASSSLRETTRTRGFEI